MESRAAREATWAALQRDLERERGPHAALRALRTPIRVALVVAAAIAPAIAMLLRHRPQLELAHGALAVLMAPVSAALLATLGKPRRDRARTVLGGFSALVPVLAALVGGELDTSHAPPANAAACFGVGVAYTAALFALVVLAARSPLRGATEAALLAGLCGVSASLMLDLHCASRALPHLLLGHASVGFAWALAYQAATTGSASSSGRSNTSTMSKMS